MILVVGATGLLGSAIVHELAAKKVRVRALVRETASAEKRTLLQAVGAQLVSGDLKHGGSLRGALEGVRTVVSTASSTLSRQDGDSVQSVDLDGQLQLVEAAARGGVQHFVFVSFAPLSVDCALQRAKREVERAVQQSGMSYTILQPVDFMEIWLGPALGFDPLGGKAVIWGNGRARTNWIALSDVAWYAAAATESTSARNQVLQLGGSEALSQLEVIALFEQRGIKVALEHVSAELLRQQLENASDPLSEAFAALQLTTSQGWFADASQAHRILPHQLKSLRSYVSGLVEGHTGRAEHG